MSAQWRVIFALAIGLPAAAQVQWVGTSDPAATSNPVYVNSQKDRVCSVQPSADTYAGIERSGQCQYVLNGAVQTSSQYKVGVGLGKWEGSGLSGASDLGEINGLTTRVCRAKVDGSYVAGYTTGVPAVCQLPGSSGAATASQFEQLYNFDTAGEFQIRQRDLCLAFLGGTVAPVQVRTCMDTPNYRWKFQTVGAAVKIESVGQAGQCVNRFISPFTFQPTVGLAPCSQAPSFNLNWAFDTTYRITDSVVGDVMSRATDGWTSANPVIYRANGSLSHLSTWEILTINEASRRLSVLSYNVMMLPGDFFPGLRQEDRAGWIPASLDRLGILADVLTFQEGFHLKARQALFASLLPYGYFYLTGTPDWPESVYAAGRSLLFVQPYTNGGMFLASRWPIERTAYLRFQNRSQDEIFDGTWFDSLAAKGVTYARINKLGRRYHVFTTHLQAGSPADEGAVRRAQLQEMKAFIDLQLAASGAAPDDGVVFTGDFNTDMELDVSNYTYLLNTLNASFVDAPRPVGASSPFVPLRWTVDPLTNDISSKRDSTLQWLDYVLRGNMGARVDRASYLVFQPEHTEDFQINVTALLQPGGYGGFQTKDLSDHGSLFSRLVFRPSASVVQPSELVSTLLQTQSGGVDIPDGVMVVDGGSVVTPQNLITPRGEPLQVTAISPLPGPTGNQYVFDRFGIGGGPSITFTPTRTDDKLTADYRRQVQLRPTIVPGGAGTVSNAFEYFELDSEVNVTATPANGFRFVQFASDRFPTTAADPVPVRFRDKPVELTATFESLGAPRLALITAGARQYLANQVVRIPLRVTNSGLGGATNVKVQMVAATAVSGTGAFFVSSQQSATFGTVPVNTQVAAQNIDVFWPTTATRVRFDFLITADGYSTPFSLTIFR